MEKYDVIIVGTGAGGLYAALNLSPAKKILMITKAKVEECDSFLAQGGICMLKNDADYDSYFEDTMRAGHYENNKESVRTMILNSQKTIKRLISYGVDFERNADGSLKFTREGAHSTPRILFHQDITGKEITSKLLAAVRKLPNVKILEDTEMTDIIEENGKCVGIVVVRHCEPACHSERSEESLSTDVSQPLNMTTHRDVSASPQHDAHSDASRNEHFDASHNGHSEASRNGHSEASAEESLYATDVIWATGGIGGTYEHSTNFPHLTGDALRIAKKHGIPVLHEDYVQIHPTTLYVEPKPGKKRERSFLISESVRGEGGILLDKNLNRFVDELLPRDKVTEAIYAQMKKDGTKHVWLSMKAIPENVIKTHFAHIYERCLEEGIDCTKDLVPVVPAQHYFMGGVGVDQNSMTSLPHLYAVGETSCNGVHGKNRLASNSLLETLVFAEIAAKKINGEKQ